jgi:hypothetical protein
MEITLDGRTVTVRPLTVGELRALGGAWEEALAALASCPEAELSARLPALLTALAPCLCRMTGLTADALDALPLPELPVLLRAVGAVHRRPFPPS